MKTNILKKMSAPICALAIIGSLFMGGAATYAEPDDPVMPDEPGLVVIYTLRYFINDSEYSEPQSCQAEAGESCEIEIEARDPIGGYRFLGWSKSVDGSEPLLRFGDTVTMTENTDLHAAFDRDDPAPMPTFYNVALSFGENSGVAFQCEGTTSDGCVFTFPEEDDEMIPEKEGYKIIGFSDSEEAKDAEYSLGEKIYVAEDRIFYAVWEKLPVKVPDTGMFTSGDEGSEMTIMFALVGVTVFSLMVAAIARKRGRGHYTYK